MSRSGVKLQIKNRTILDDTRKKFEQALHSITASWYQKQSTDTQSEKQRKLLLSEQNPFVLDHMVKWALQGHYCGYIIRAHKSSQNKCLCLFFLKRDNQSNLSSGSCILGSEVYSRWTLILYLSCFFRRIDSNVEFLYPREQNSRPRLVVLNRTFLFLHLGSYFK